MNPHSPRMIEKRCSAMAAHLASQAIILMEPTRWTNLIAQLDAVDAPFLAAITAKRAEGQPETDIYGDPIAKPALRGTDMIIPIHGAIVQGLPSIARMLGYVDPRTVASQIAAADANPEVARIILDINSPGGSVSGIPELAAVVASVSKPVVAQTDSMIASAAYWIAAPSSSIEATLSAEVGSIGVYTTAIDMADALASMGIHAELFKGGTLKASSHPMFRNTNEQRAHIQSRVDAIYADFKATVQANRPKVQEASMQGQTFSGLAARQAQLIDAVI